MSKNKKQLALGVSAAVVLGGGAIGGTMMYLNQDDKPVLPSSKIEGKKDNEDEKNKERDKAVEDSKDDNDSDLADEVLVEKDKEENKDGSIEFILQGDTVLEEGSAIEEDGTPVGDSDLVTILQEKETKNKGTMVDDNSTTVVQKDTKEDKGTVKAIDSVKGNTVLQDKGDSNKGNAGKGDSDKVEKPSTPSQDTGKDEKPSNPDKDTDKDEKPSKPSKPSNPDKEDGNGNGSNNGNGGNSGNNGNDNGNGSDNGNGGNGNDSGNNGNDNGSDSGNDNEKPVDPTPVDPIPTLQGIADVTIEHGSNFDPRKGVILGENGKSFEVSGTVDTSKKGDYTLTYTVKSKTGATKTYKRVVTVKPKVIDGTIMNQAPEIKVSDKIVNEIDFASDFDALDGITADDKEDGDLTDKIEVRGTINTEEAGKQTITYIVTDSGGASHVVKRTVTVKENQAPVFRGVSDKTVDFESDFDLLDGVTAHDKEDGDVTDKIVVDGNVDTSKVGKTDVTYSVTDSHGKTTKETVTITVKVTDAQINKAKQEVTNKVNAVPNVEEEAKAIKDKYENFEEGLGWRDLEKMPLVDGGYTDRTDKLSEKYGVVLNLKDIFEGHSDGDSEQARKDYNKERLVLENMKQALKSDLENARAEYSRYVQAHADGQSTVDGYVEKVTQLEKDYTNALKEVQAAKDEANRLNNLANKEDVDFTDVDSQLETLKDAFENSESVMYVKETLKDDYKQALDSYKGYSTYERFSGRPIGDIEQPIKYVDELPIVILADGTEESLGDKDFDENDYTMTESEYTSLSGQVTSLIETVTSKVNADVISSQKAEAEAQVEEAKASVTEDEKAFNQAKQDFDTKYTSAKSSLDKAQGLVVEKPSAEDVTAYANAKADFDTKLADVKQAQDTLNTSFDTLETTITNAMSTVGDLKADGLGNFQADLDELEAQMEKLRLKDSQGNYQSEITDLQENVKSTTDSVTSQAKQYQTDIENLADVSGLQTKLDEAKGSNNQAYTNVTTLTNHSLPEKLEVVEEEVEEETTEEETEKPETKETQEKSNEKVEETGSQEVQQDKETEVKEVEQEEAVEETEEDVQEKEQVEETTTTDENTEVEETEEA